MSQPSSMASLGLPSSVSASTNTWAVLPAHRLHRKHRPFVVGAASLVCALHVAVFALVLSAPEPRTDSAPVHVVSAELINPAPTASAIPTPAVPRRVQPATHERSMSVPRSAPLRVAPPVREHVAEPSRQEAPVSPPMQPLSSAPQPEASQAAPPGASAQRTGADDNAQHAPAAAAPRTVAQLGCTIAKPAYPMLSRRRNESGTVLVELRVDVSGHVESAHVAASSGYPRLDTAALDAVLAGTCVPYREGGQPQPAIAKVPVVFNLSDRD